MANLTRRRQDLAAWANGTPITNKEMDSLDGDLIKCPNFAEGCSMSPTAPVNVGGTSGMTFSAVTPCALGGNTTVGTTSANTCIVASTVTFNGPVTCTGNLTLNGNTIIGNAIGDTLVVNATPTFVNPVGFSSTISVSSTISAGGTISGPTVSAGTVSATTVSATTLGATGTSTLAGDGTLGTSGSNVWEFLGALIPGASSGSLRLRLSSVSLASAGTFSSDGSQFLRIVSLGGADRNLTSLATRAEHSFKFISNEDAAKSIFVLNYDTTPICTLAPRIGVLIVSDGTLWHPILSGALLI
jgi:hypothetical protein